MKMNNPRPNRGLRLPFISLLADDLRDSRQAGSLAEELPMLQSEAILHGGLSWRILNEFGM